MTNISPDVNGDFNHTCFSEGNCLYGVKQVGKVGLVLTERGERFTVEVQYWKTADTSVSVSMFLYRQSVYSCSVRSYVLSPPFPNPTPICAALVTLHWSSGPSNYINVSACIKAFCGLLWKCRQRLWQWILLSPIPAQEGGKLLVEYTNSLKNSVSHVSWQIVVLNPHHEKWWRN